MQVVLQDLRFVFRQIIHNPGYSLTAVLSLTLGIGATVAWSRCEPSNHQPLLAL